MWKLRLKSREENAHDFAVSEHDLDLDVDDSIRRGRTCLFSLLDSDMRRSWPRYVFVTPQGTDSILPYLT